jgi:hypothetical protein
MQSTIDTPLPDRPNSAPPPVKSDARPAFGGSNQSSLSVPTRSTPGKAMQLGGAKVLGSSGLADSNMDWALAAAAEAVNPWGNDDLMDVNADEDDWSKLLHDPS